MTALANCNVGLESWSTC